MYFTNQGDVRYELLRHLNYHNHAFYRIKKKRNKAGKIVAAVYYDYKEQTYLLGYFGLKDRCHIQGDFHKYYQDLSPLTQLQIESATNKFLRQFKVLKVKQEGGIWS